METIYDKLLEFTNEKNAFMIHNGVRITDVAKDYAATAADLAPNALNPLGAAHGGFLFTLADCAAGAAARSDGRSYVTLNTNFNFMRMAKEGTVTANATVTKRGKTVTLVDATVECEGKRLADATFTFFCLSADEPANPNPTKARF